MCKTTRSQASSERKKWDKIFSGLVKMLKSQQEQLETLVKERNILEGHIKMQHEKWVSDVRLYEDHISQMKSEAVTKDKLRMFDAEKSDWVVESKHREASVWKLKFEYADDELADNRAWFDLLIQKPEISEGELRRLKLDYDKLAAEKKSKVSALLDEKAFVWNQYKVMENDLTSKIKSKHAEVDRANEKIETLLASMEQLQSSNNRKDETIARLKTEVAEMEAGSVGRNVEISRLTQELEQLRKSRSNSAMPVLNHCSAGATTSHAAGSCQATIGIKGRLRKSRNSSVMPLSSHCTTKPQSLGGKNGDSFLMKAQVPATHVRNHVDTEKGSRSSKRKAVEVSPILDTPKLFSSKFKVPKLKNSSSHLCVR